MRAATRVATPRPRTRVAARVACCGRCCLRGVEPVSETLRGEAPRTLLLRGVLGGVQAACQASCGTPASDVATHGV